MRPIDLLLSRLCGSAFAVSFVFARASWPEGRRPMSITPAFTRAIHFRFAVPRETNRTARFRICRKFLERSSRNVREARNSSGWLAAHQFPFTRDALLGDVWAGATPRSLWAAESPQRWGRSSPLRCFAHTQIECRAARILSAPQYFRSPQR